MRKTIREEMNVKPLREVLINDNTLLIYRKNEENENLIDVSVRHVEGNAIKEQFLKTVPRDKITSGLIEINYNGTAIAIYQEEGEDYVLESIYTVEDHLIESSDGYLQFAYKKHFSDHTPYYERVKKRGTKNGNIH